MKAHRWFFQDDNVKCTGGPMLLLSDIALLFGGNLLILWNNALLFGEFGDIVK